MWPRHCWHISPVLHFLDKRHRGWKSLSSSAQGHSGREAQTWPGRSEARWGWRGLRLGTLGTRAGTGNSPAKAKRQSHTLGRERKIPFIQHLWPLSRCSGVVPKSCWIHLFGAHPRARADHRQTRQCDLVKAGWGGGQVSVESGDEQNVGG